MTTLGLTPCKPPWKELRNWISPSHDTCHTDQTWQLITSTFFPKLRETPRGHVYVLDEGVEKSVKTWVKEQVVEFFRDSFEKLVHFWQKCVENGGDCVEN